MRVIWSCARELANSFLGEALLFPVKYWTDIFVYLRAVTRSHLCGTGDGV